MASLPSLFLAHGAPDLSLVQHPARSFLETLDDVVERPRAILMISAHWESRRVELTTGAAPETIYDFYGWPPELYEIVYPAKTDATLIERCAALLEAAGIDHRLNPKRGYDHGAWVPMRMAYPEADVPIVQLSLLKRTGAKEHFELGKVLAPLREEGFLVVGSGATVHNLRMMAPEGSPVPIWAEAFDQWLFDSLERRDLEGMLSFPNAPKTALAAHPTIEHFLPFFVAMGAGWDGGSSQCLHQSYSYGSLGMSCYAFGDA